MKCSMCQGALDSRGVVVTVVSNGATYTATLHSLCLYQVVGAEKGKRLEGIAFSSGWVQSGLPLLYDTR